MGLFKKSTKKQGVEAILQEDPASESGLTKDAEEAVTLMAMKMSFKGLALAMKHPSPKVRKYVVSLIGMAGNIKSGPDGSVMVGFTADEKLVGPGAAQAIRLLKAAAKDPDASVSSSAQAILDEQ